MLSRNKTGIEMVSLGFLGQNSKRLDVGLNWNQVSSLSVRPSLLPLNPPLDIHWSILLRRSHEWSNDCHTLLPHAVVTRSAVILTTISIGIIKIKPCYNAFDKPSANWIVELILVKSEAVFVRNSRCFLLLGYSKTRNFRVCKEFQDFLFLTPKRKERRSKNW